MNKQFFAKIAIAVSLLVSSFAFSANAQAADGHLVFNTAAIHFKNFNERNAFVPGLGWEYSPTGKFGFHVGAASDSFGAASTYLGINYGTRRFLDNRVRFLLGATILRKQFHVNGDLETKVVPFPVMEVSFTERASLNITGSPQIDFNGSRNNAVLFFQFKYNLR